MLRLLLLFAVLVGCKDNERERVPPAQAEKHQPPPTPRVDPAAAARERNTALGTAPYDYKATDKPCPIEIPRQLSSPDVTFLEVADIQTAPPTRGDSGSGYETIVVAEVQSNQRTIGRILVWDRAAKKMICGTAFNDTNSVIAATRAQHALETAKPLALVDSKLAGAAIPDHMPARTGKRVLEVAIGDSHFCALVEDGTVRCFGQNDVGQVGDMKGPNIVAKPFKVPGITDAFDIAAGGKHTCVRRKSGAVTCWGENFFGQCGPGKQFKAMVTQQLGATTQLATGDDHTCVLRKDGSITCWGDSSPARGVWKDKLDDQREPSPRKLELAPAAELCTSGAGTCARLTAGGVQCWGTHFGEKPVTLPGSENATSLLCDAGAWVICWTDATHTPHCATDRGPFDLPASLMDVAWLGIGSDHACALKTDGTVECWGKNEWGQLGDGTQVQSPTPSPTRAIVGDPRRVKPLERVKQLAVGNERSGAILEDGALAVWGYGPIGDGRDCSGPPCDGLVPTVIPLE